MSVKVELKDRESVSLLVRSFYAKVRKDPLLGPIFNAQIQDWEPHLEHLTDFWESNLFFKKTYNGDPIGKHIGVDRKMDQPMEAQHFGVWLNLWFETIDSLFEGEVAQIAKNRARNMGTFIHLKVFGARTPSNK